MSDINFLDNKPGGDEEKSKDGSEKKERLVWSDPEKKADGRPSSPFSFLPFIGGKNAVGEKSAVAIDKSQLKRSRQEILALIKRQENLKPPPKAKDKSFLTSLAGKLKKQSAPKEALIDYQRIFKREKELKEPSGKIFNIKSIVENKPVLAVEKPKSNWPGWLSRLFKSKIASPDVRPSRKTKIIKPFKAEKVKSEPVQPSAAKEIKFKKPEARAAGRILETNLMRGELAAFFDWRSKIIILAASVLAPLAIVAAVYYGLALYQKNSQAENSALAQKFSELEQAVSREEGGFEEILAFQSRLKTVSEIFKQHLYWTNFFKFLEDNTIKEVYFTGFEGDTSGNYALDALTANYGGIAEQVKVFRDNKKIAAVSVNGGELASGDDKNQSLVKFILDFSLLKSIFTE